jgi:O-acetyl-ADP-ribose deacetylase (regulator of RNase III)
VIHAVGPVWGEGDEDAKLGAAVTGSLRLADRLNMGSIAFPAISTGIFGFPKEKAAQVILGAIREYFTEFPASSLELVRLTLFDQSTIEAFINVWERILE